MSDEGWNQDVVGLILGCCFVFFLILSQCKCNIVKRLLCGVTSSSSPREFVDESIPNDDSLQFQSSDFELSSVINALPVYQFKKNKGEGEGEQMPINEDCAICLGEFEEGELLKLIPNCTHGFHVSCIDIWFQFHSNCPLCRTHVRYDPVAEECSVSFNSLLETLSMEEFSPDRTAHFQSIRSQTLQNLEHRRQESSPDC